MAHMGSPARPRHSLAAIIGLAVILRAGLAAWILAWSPSRAGFHALDTPSYILPALELARDFSFSIDGVPNIYRTPGYSLCLVPGVALGQVELWAVFLHLLWAAATALGVYRLADGLFRRPGAALAAALLYAIDPLSIFHTCQVTSETAFTGLLVWCLERLAAWLRRREDLRPLAAAGLLLAAATLVRPVSLYLPYALAAFLATACLPRESARGRLLLRLALFVALAAGPVLAWQLRNFLATGYGGVSSVVAVNAYYFQAAAVKARLEGRPMVAARMAMGYERELRLTEHPRERTVDQAEHFRDLQRQAGEILRAHWPLYLKIHFAGLLKVLTNPGASGYLVIYNRYAEVEAVAGVYPEGGALQAAREFRRMRPAFLLSNLALGLLLVSLYLAALRGVARSWREWSAGLSLLVLVAAYFTAVSGGANAVSRFRHPIMPILCVFAGAGLLRRPVPGPSGAPATAPSPFG